MDPRYRRALSPGSHRISIPGRSSNSRFDDYDDGFYSRSPRDYTSSRLDSMYGPSPRSSGSSLVDPYTGKSRRGTYDRGDASTSRSYREEYKPRREHHKVYNVDDKHGARLVGERDVAREKDDLDRPPRERRYPPSGSYNRQREVADEEFSYTDPIGMYRDTEPRRRRRNGSADREQVHTRWGSQDSYELPSRMSTKDYGRAPLPRALERLNDGPKRRETIDERTSSRDRGLQPERSSTYDHYSVPTAYEMPMRGGRPLSMVDFAYDEHLPQYKNSRPSRRTQDSEDEDYDPRRSRGRYQDDQVQTRGFGIRSGSNVMPELSPERKVPLAIEPPPRRPTVDVYDNDGILLPPDPHDYMPRASLELDDKRTELDKRDRERYKAPESHIPKASDYNRQDHDLNLSGRSEKGRSHALDRQPRRGKDDNRESRRSYSVDYGKDRDEERAFQNHEPLRDQDLGHRRNRENGKSRKYDNPTDGEIRHDRESDDSDNHRFAKGAAVATAGAGAAAYAAHASSENRTTEYEQRRNRDETSATDVITAQHRGSTKVAPRARDVYQDDLQDMQRDRHNDRVHDRSSSEDDLNDGGRVRDIPTKETRMQGEDFEAPRKTLRDEPRDSNRRSEMQAKPTQLGPDISQYDGTREEYQDQGALSRERGVNAQRSDPRDKESQRHRDQDEDDDDLVPRRASRHEPNLRDDMSEREFDDRDKDLRRRGTLSEEEEAAEDYRRRVLQTQQELNSFVPGPPPPGAYPDETPNRSRDEISRGDIVEEPLQIQSSEGREKEKNRVRIVEPPKKEEFVAPVKGILRKPTEKFPDHPNTVREGALPLKEEAAKRGIPTGARWTKIKRSLVNPEALVQAKERFEERLDYVIVLRVLSKDEIQTLANLTTEIRNKRDDEYNQDRENKKSGKRREDDLDESDDTDDDDYDLKKKRNSKHDDKTEAETKRRRDLDRDREEHSHGHRGDRERERERGDRDRDTHKEPPREKDRDRERERDRSRV